MKDIKTKRTTDKNHLEGIFSEALTSSNTVFTHRAIRASVRPRHFEEAGSGGQPCEPNRIAAAPLGLKVLGIVNTQNVR
jgi:hypothetical protein